MTDETLIAIAAEDDRGLDGEVSGHFGRCPYYAMVAVRDEVVRSVTVLANPFFGAHQPGALPPFLHRQGASVIVAGGMGPRAVTMFQGFGIEVATGAIGNVGKVLEAYLRGEIRGVVPCAHDHPDSCGDHGRGTEAHD